VTKTIAIPGGDRILLVAFLTAVTAAIFMVGVWGPLQVRAFDELTQAAWADTSASLATSSTTPVDDARWEHIPLVTAEGDSTDVAASTGQVRIVTMMYTHCPGVCPLAISMLQQMASRLTVSEQQQFSVLAVSLDAERDSLARLREFRGERRIDSRHWIIARPSAEGARRLAAALGVSYRVLSDGTVDHQSVFVLLDKSGRVLARTSNTRSVDPKFLVALQAAFGAS
jgi:protein SCO1/2